MITITLLKRLRHEKLRTIAAVVGVAAATALLVWSMGLTYTTIGQSREKARSMTRPFNCWINTQPAGFGRGAPPPVARPGGSPVISDKVVSAVKGVPGVESALSLSVLRATLDYRPDGRVMQGPPLMATMTLAPPSGSPYSDAAMTGEWPDVDAEAPLAAVCSAVFTPRRLTPPPLGSPLVLLTTNGALTVTIAAIIDMPRVAPGFPTLFTTASVMKEARGGADEPAEANLLLCKARNPQAVADGVAGLSGAGEALPNQVTTRSVLEEQSVSDAIRNFKRQAPLLLTLAALTGLCILVNTMMVGIALQERTLALLRITGMTARQVARTVAIEGLFTAFLGWVFGVLSGWGALAIFVSRNAETFPEGVFLGWQTAPVAAAGVAVVTALALILPCRQALRIRPLDAIEDVPPLPAAPALRRILLGVVLLMPLLIFALPLPFSALWRNILMLAVGLPVHCIGLWLVLPGVVSMVERLAVAPLGLLLGLDRRLLMRRDGRHAARVAGMVLTLAVGLGSFVAIHVWGSSMMSPFVPSRTFPDVIVSILPRGVPVGAAAKVSQLEGVADHRCLAIEAVQRDLTPAMLERISKTSGKETTAGNVLFLGADPLAVFGGEKPLAAFVFREGERLAAATALARGDSCVITKMFSRYSGLKVGDDLKVMASRPSGGRGGRGGGPGAGRPAGRPEAAEARGSSRPGGRPGPGGVGENVAPEASFKIVGVIDLNWHLVTSRSNVRGRYGYSGMTTGPVFVNEDVARRFSGNSEKTYHLWANLHQDYRALGALPAGQKLEAEIRKVLKVDEDNTIRVHHRDEIEDGTLAHGAHLIGAIARVPFWSLVVLTTGIAALLVASVRARAREVAVMRAVGMTRSQLGRMLLGEALLTTLCGVVLSLLGGGCIGWAFTGVTRAAMSFGGLPLTLVIPWLTLAKGVGFALVLCVVMALPSVVWLTYRVNVQTIE